MNTDNVNIFTVYEFEDLLNDINTLKINSENAPNPLPVLSRFRFAIREAYAWNRDDLAPLEFFFEASDFRLMYSKQSAVDVTQVWVDAQQFFDICAPWQTTSCVVANGTGSQQCQDGKYQGACSLVACNAGFGYDEKSNTCQPCTIGTYNNDGTLCLPCQNKPEYSYYINSSTTSTCPFMCNEGYIFQSNECVPSANDIVIGKVLFGFIIALCFIFLVFAIALLVSIIVYYVKNRKSIAPYERARLI